MYTSSSFENDRRYNGGRLYSDDVFTCDEKLFATYECIKNLNAEFVVLNNDPSETNSNSGIQKGILINPQAVDDGNEMADTAECTRKKSKTIRSVSFHEEEKKQFDTDLEFGIKSYLHEFYEPISMSEALRKGDDFEFYVEPNHKTGNLYWSIILKCVVVVAFALLYTLGVMFFFTMPEEMERSAVGLSIFAVTLFFSFLLTFLIVWWMCNSIMEDGGHSEPNVYSGVLNADLMREVYSTAAEPNTYFRKIPFTSELKAVQYER